MLTQVVNEECCSSSTVTSAIIININSASYLDSGFQTQQS